MIIMMKVIIYISYTGKLGVKLSYAIGTVTDRGPFSNTDRPLRLGLGLRPSRFTSKKNIIVADFFVGLVKIRLTIIGTGVARNIIK